MNIHFSSPKVQHRPCQRKINFILYFIFLFHIIILTFVSLSLFKLVLKPTYDLYRFLSIISFLTHEHIETHLERKSFYFILLPYFSNYIVYGNFYKLFLIFSGLCRSIPAKYVCLVTLRTRDAFFIPLQVLFERIRLKHSFTQCSFYFMETSIHVIKILQHCIYFIYACPKSDN